MTPKKIMSKYFSDSTAFSTLNAFKISAPKRKTIQKVKTPKAIESNNNFVLMLFNSAKFFSNTIFEASGNNIMFTGDISAIMILNRLNQNAIFPAIVSEKKLEAIKVGTAKNNPRTTSPGIR